MPSRIIRIYGLFFIDPLRYLIIFFLEVVKLLVGNKVDRERVISRQQAEEWAKARGMLFVEASAKTTEGVTQVFSEVAQQVRWDWTFFLKSEVSF